ncbi:MAG: hypothetical protein ABIW79_01225 [Gemmatimonas sp.]
MRRIRFIAPMILLVARTTLIAQETPTQRDAAKDVLRKMALLQVMNEPGKPQGFEETGSVSSDIPGNGFSAQISTSPFHSYGMESDALSSVGHNGFVVDAQAMTALLFDFATRPEYRAAVKREFAGLRALYGEYQDALKKAYVVPKVGQP